MIDSPLHDACIKIKSFIPKLLDTPPLSGRLDVVVEVSALNIIKLKAVLLENLHVMPESFMEINFFPENRNGLYFLVETSPTTNLSSFSKVTYANPLFTLQAIRLVADYFISVSAAFSDTNNHNAVNEIMSDLFLLQNNKPE